MPDEHDTSMQDLKPTVWIGKQGCSETMIEEIVAQLKKRKLIKIKWLQNTEVDPVVVAAQAKAKLVEVRGRTMVLAEKAKAAPAPPAHKPARVTAREAARPAGARNLRPSAKIVAKGSQALPKRQTGTLARSKK